MTGVGCSRRTGRRVKKMGSPPAPKQDRGGSRGWRTTGGGGAPAERVEIPAASGGDGRPAAGGVEPRPARARTPPPPCLLRRGKGSRPRPPSALRCENLVIRGRTRPREHPMRCHTQQGGLPRLSAARGGGPPAAPFRVRCPPPPLAGEGEGGWASWAAATRVWAPTAEQPMGGPPRPPRLMPPPAGRQGGTAVPRAGGRAGTCGGQPSAAPPSRRRGRTNRALAARIAGVARRPVPMSPRAHGLCAGHGGGGPGRVGDAGGAWARFPRDGGLCRHAQAACAGRLAHATLLRWGRRQKIGGLSPAPGQLAGRRRRPGHAAQTATPRPAAAPAQQRWAPQIYVVSAASVIG